MTVLLSFFYFYFFFNDTATTEIYTLSLHDALPIYSPIWSCSRWGLPCRRRYRNRGALLPHRFTLTAASKDRGGLFSVALSLRSLSPGVTRHRLSVEPGLSSTTAASRGGSCHPAIWHGG